MHLFYQVLNTFFFPEFAKSGKNPPDGFMIPEAWKIVSDYYKNSKTNAVTLT